MPKPHQDLFDRGLKKVRSVLAVTNKAQQKHTDSLNCVSTPDFFCIGLTGERWQPNSMGKSNKFDYSNRTNGGSKLGSIIGRDLEKEADKVVRDATRRARKSSTGSSISGVSSLDLTEAIVHTLDIKAPSKQLGDEGACALAAGLKVALTAGTRCAAVLLEDLNLSDNGITTVTLARLAPVIQLARYDLKTLNLTNNSIRVESDQEATEWETFLRSFEHCLKLRRLDLSGNTELGPRALEIFARVHAQEPQINPMSGSSNFSVISLGNEETCDADETPASACFGDAMTDGGVVKRRCGLRGIPYLTFTNVGLNDTGALWLSYVLEDHHYPIQLTDTLNATAANSCIRTYAQEAGSLGLDWNPKEPLLGRDGLTLLKKTEAIRRQSMFDDGSIMESSMIESIESTQARACDRRASIRSIATTDGGEHELSELESLRTKLMRHIIADRGIMEVELWRAGLRAAISSTVLTGLGPRVRDRNPAVFYTGPPRFHVNVAPSSPAQGKENRPQTPGSISHGSPQSKDAGRHGTYAQTLTVNTSVAAGEPELVLTEVTNTPTTPRMIFKPHRKGAFSDGSDLQAVNQKLDGLVIRGHCPYDFVRWQEATIERRGGFAALRNASVPSQLPKHLMDRIVSYAVSEREWSLLAEKQQRNVCAWGQDRNNFGARESWRKMPQSSQVLSLLEAIECQDYQAA